MKVKSMKKAVAMACAFGMIVTSGAVPGSVLTAEASNGWTWNADTSESGYSKFPTSGLSATADSCAGSTETGTSGKDTQTNGSWNNAVDGNVNTYWHSRYANSGTGEAGNPATGNADNVTGNNTFTVTLANPGAVQGVTYLSRQSQLANGYFHKFKVEVQKEGEETWIPITEYKKVEDGSADSTGLITLTALTNDNFESHKFEKEFIFSEAQDNVKKIRFTVTAVRGGGAFLNAAEISVLKPKNSTVSNVTVTSETGVTTVAKIDSTLQLNATVETKNEETAKTVTWTSSDTDVATVSDTGLVTFKKKNGSTTITATSTVDTEKSAAITLNLAAKEAEQESAIVEDGTADNNDGGTLNPNITWNGNWSVWSGEKTNGVNKYHGNSKADANANGAYFEYTFTGTGIAYYAQMHSNQGTMNVKIGAADANEADMEDLGEFSFNDGSANGTPQKEVFSKRGLEPGTYKVRFTRTSANKGINFDFLKVYSLGEDTAVTVDKAELQNQLERKAGLTATDYSAEKWSAYCEAYNTAVAVMNKAAATEEEVTAQVTALEKAYTVLTTKVDKTALNAAINEATELVAQTGTYTTASLAELQKALDSAKELATNDSVEQNAVDAAVEAINTAKTALVEIKVTDMTVTAPTKIVYERGEELDTTGMVVTVTDNNGKSRELAADEYTVEGFDSATAGEKTVTVKYGDLEKSFTVTVNACYIVTVDGKEYTRGQYDAKITVIAEEKEGQTFAGWKQNGKVVSSDKTYTFYLAGDVELESVYDQEINVEPQAQLSNVIVTKADESGKGSVKYVGQLVVPKGYTVEECGLIWSAMSPKTVPVLYTYENGTLTLPSKVYKTPSIYGSNTVKQFSITVTGIPKKGGVRGVIYAKVSNDVESKYVFSEMGTGKMQ